MSLPRRSVPTVSGRQARGQQDGQGGRVSGVPPVASGTPAPPRLAASPTLLHALLDCPRRFRMLYLDRPSPRRRPPRAHTTLGVAVHSALAKWWDVPERTPQTGADLLRAIWTDVGFRDAAQSRVWREHSAAQVAAYLGDVDPSMEPAGIERTLGFPRGPVRFTGRIDRLDDRAGELVVVDYKTSRQVPTDDDARTSLALALYAAAAWRVFRRRVLRVELHHVPTGTVRNHEHTPDSLTRKVDEATSLALDAWRLEVEYAEHGSVSGAFPPRVGPLCAWCDVRAHCPPGQEYGPEKSDWAALD